MRRFWLIWFLVSRCYGYQTGSTFWSNQIGLTFLSFSGRSGLRCNAALWKWLLKAFRWHPELRPVISYTNLEMTPAPVRLTLPIIKYVTTRFYWTTSSLFFCAKISVGALTRVWRELRKSCKQRDVCIIALLSALSLVFRAKERLLEV